jgi:long-chain-fatty-acid--CoA ligase ACSBG
VYITGRIKELIITAGGENIAPVPIEQALLKEMPALSNVVVIGDRKKFNVILCAPKSVPNLETGSFHNKLAAEALEVNPDVTTVTGVALDEEWSEYVTKGIKAYNEKHAASNAQKVQKFDFLKMDLSIPGGELTPTMKLKRDFVATKYAKAIDALYEDPMSP